MSYSVLLILVSAFLHAVWNSIVKASGQRLAVMSVIQLAGLVCGVGLVFIFGMPHAAAWPYLIGTTFIHLFYQVFLLYAYKLGDLSKVYPIARGSGPLWVASVSWCVGEHLSQMSIAGVLLVSLGISLLGLKNAFHEWRALVAALLTGLMIGAYTVVDGLGIRNSGNPLAYIGLFLILNGPGFALVARWHMGKAWYPAVKGQLMHGIFVSLIANVGYGLSLWVMNSQPLAFVASIRETSVIFAAVIGTIFLRESFGYRRVVAAIVVAVGTIILSLGRV